MDTISHENLIPSEASLDSGIPKAVRYPVVYNQQLDLIPTDPDAKSEFRSKEVSHLAERLHALPSDTFDEMRDQEMLRLSPYFDAFSDIYGIDLRSTARTRMQATSTVMNSSVLLLQRMFEEDTKSEQTGLTFFNGRMQAGNFDFNANGNTVIDGYTMTFSVLKRTIEDSDGKFEVDYPAYSLPREVISALNEWNNTTNPGRDLSENPLLAVGSELMSRRVHDWIHASFLYDTQAINKAFQQWSKDSFFVPHFLADPGQINYELMSNHMHFRVWQHIFENNPDAKKQVIEEATQYLSQVDKFAQWSGDNEMANFLGYIGMRGVFDILRYDDPDLTEALKDVERFQYIKGEIPDSSRAFLDKIYQDDEKYYFREGTDQQIDLEQILREYVQGLTSEAEIIRAKSENIALKSGVSFRTEGEKLPNSIKLQIDNIPADKLDARLLRQFNQTIEQMSQDFDPEIVQFLAEQIEVDEEGLFYLKVNREDVDLAESEAVKQKKHAILVQIPYTDTNQRTLVIQTANNLLSTHKRAEAEISAGDLITINTQNRSVANRILNESRNDAGEFDIEQFFSLIHKESQKGLVELGDAYPYEIDKALQVYNIDPENITTDTEGRTVIEPGFYATHINKRQAVGVEGPISMDAAQDPNSRRRILKGAAVENHVQKEGQLDIFPVYYESFDTFYAGSHRRDLPPLRLNNNFSGNFDNDSVNNAVSVLLPELESINDKKIHGFRGKPQIPSFGALVR